MEEGSILPAVIGTEGNFIIAAAGNTEILQREPGAINRNEGPEVISTVRKSNERGFHLGKLIRKFRKKGKIIYCRMHKLRLTG